MGFFFLEFSLLYYQSIVENMTRKWVGFCVTSRECSVGNHRLCFSSFVVCIYLSLVGFILQKWYPDFNFHGMSQHPLKRTF